MVRPRKSAAKVQDTLLTPDNVVEIPVEEQPYPLPNGWKWVYLKNGYEVTSSKRIKKSDWRDSGIPFYRTRELVKLSNYCFVDNELFIDEGLYALIKLKFGVPQVNDILISGVGTIGVPYIISDSAKFYFKDGNIIWLKNKNIFLPKFIFYLFKSAFINQQIHEMSAGTTVDTYTIVNANKTKLPYPPIDEQQRIVDRIESLFAKLDEAREKAEAVLDGFESRKAAILHKAFTGELTHSIPSNFLPITNFVQKEKNSIKAGPFGSALKKDFYVPSGYKIYGQEQVISGDEDFGNYYINEEKYQELKSCKVNPGDILISLVGTVGKVLILSENCEPGIINPRLIKVTLDQNKMTPKFFSYYFQSDETKASYKESTHGTTMDVLNMSILKQLKFPCFTLAEQQEIVRILDNLLAKERQARDAAESVLEHINLMKKSILARAFRGELTRQLHN